MAPRGQLLISNAMGEQGTPRAQPRQLRPRLMLWARLEEQGARFPRAQRERSE